MTAAEQHRFRPKLIYSLRLRLMVMSFILILLPMGLAAWSVLFIVQQHLNRDASRQLQSGISAASLYYQAQVEKTRSAVQAVALDNMVKTTLRLNISGQLQKHLDELARRHGLDVLLIVDPAGRVRISSFSRGRFGRDLAEVDFSEHPLIAEVGRRGTTAGSLLEENAFLLDLLERKGKDIDFKPVVLMEAAARITLRDTLLGTVLGGVMVTDNLDLIDGIESAAGIDRVEIVAADRMVVGSDIINQENGNRQVLFPIHLDYVKHASPGLKDVINHPVTGEKMVYEYLPLSMPGRDPEVALVAQRPLKDLLDVLTSLRLALLSVFAVAVLVALGAAMIMSRSIARPLHKIVQSMGDMRRGQKVEPLSCTRDDEIGDLVSGYNEMALALETRIQELGMEIRSREQAEKDLAAESERLRATLQSMDDAVLAADTRGRVVLMNRGAELLLGRPRGEVVGQGLDSVLSMYTLGQTGKMLDPLHWLSDGQQSRHSSMDVRLRAEDGDDRIVTVSGSRLVDNNNEVLGAVLVIRDVTGQRRMEEELARGQKLESVGVLAGGIAHDFNNLLTAIMGNLSLARLVSSPDDEHYQNIEDAEKASLRARELTQQLLTFSRGGSPVKGSVNIEELVRESAEFVVRGSNVRLRCSADEDLLPVHGDRGQIGQVIDNLVINAMQAMPGGGFVDISITNYLPAADSLLPLVRQQYVRIVVQDSGSGISKEDLARIFDPYFTTKEVGNGLGLAICFSIINKHGGHITAESEPGRGSIFYVYLPAVDSDEVCDVQDTAVAKAVTSESARKILVMDDEEIVCSIVRKILTYLGCEVDTALNGEEALALYGQAMEEGSGYDAVIMDLTVPGGMGGQEAVARLLEMDPQARAIVSSGYSRHQVMANYAQYGFAGVVVKPFRIDDLSQVLNEVLGE